METHPSIFAWRIPMDRGASWASPWGCKEWDTEQLSTAQFVVCLLWDFMACNCSTVEECLLIFFYGDSFHIQLMWKTLAGLASPCQFFWTSVSQQQLRLSIPTVLCFSLKANKRRKQARQFAVCHLVLYPDTYCNPILAAIDRQCDHHTFVRPDRGWELENVLEKAGELESLIALILP